MFKKIQFLTTKGLNVASGVRSSNGTQCKEIPIVQYLLAHVSHAKLVHWLDLTRKYKTSFLASSIRVETTQNVNTDKH